MRLLYLGDAAAEHLRRWSRHFAARGDEVHVVTWNPNVLDGFEPVTVHLIRKPNLPGPLGRAASLLALLPRLRRIVSETRTELVHAHTAEAYAWMARMCGHRPYMVTPWGTDILVSVRESPVTRMLTRGALIHADLVHCDGENTRDALQELGVAADRIAIATFGVDVRRFVAAQDRSAVRASLGIQGGPVVVSTRTLNPIHDVHTVIRAAQKVLPHFPQATFLIVGGGSQATELAALASELGVAEHVRFVGRVEEDQMIACLQAADLYVSTSLSESGLAASTAEAMACELPVINTDTGDIRLWLGQGDGGRVIPTQAPEALASSIVELLSDPDLAARAGARNRAEIERRNNAYVEMEKVSALYSELIRSRGRSR